MRQNDLIAQVFLNTHLGQDFSRVVLGTAWLFDPQNKAGDIGILDATVPEAYGGLGLDAYFDAISYIVHILTGDSGWGLSVHNIATHYVIAYGTEEQKHRRLPKLAFGEWVGAIGMTEPGAGSDLQSVRTRARYVKETATGATGPKPSSPTDTQQIFFFWWQKPIHLQVQKVCR